jgi:hypothetical protein
VSDGVRTEEDRCAIGTGCEVEGAVCDILTVGFLDGRLGEAYCNVFGSDCSLLLVRVYL